MVEAVGASVLAKLIGEILLEGMKLFSKERGRALMSDYHEAMSELNEARAAKYPDYSDVRVVKAEQNLKTFLEAYHAELKSVPAASSK